MTDDVPRPTLEDRERGCICTYLFNDLHRADCPLATVASEPYPQAGLFDMPGGERVTFSNERAQGAQMANRMMEQIDSGFFAGMQIKSTEVSEDPARGEKILKLRLGDDSIVEIVGQFSVERHW
jgi:hypothetical protein